MTMQKYAIVQHSGFGYGGKPEFEKGLEIRTVTKKSEEDRVKKAGGILFETYEAADAFCEKAMYPDGGHPLIPAAAGTFSPYRLDDLAIYIPVRTVTG